MTVPNPAQTGHLSNDFLVRALDDELSGTETIQVETHLAGCVDCLRRQAEFRRLSDDLESFLPAYQPSVAQMPVHKDERQELLNRLNAAKQKRDVSSSGRPLARFGWMLAAAATVAVGMSYIPFSRFLRSGDQGSASVASAQLMRGGSQPGSPFEVDGETFQYLPYSNPDLPVGGSHVVQMQVPLSSLADAGVLVEPSGNRIATPDRAVLANVLLGMDGQPIGVHVLSAN